MGAAETLGHTQPALLEGLTSNVEAVASSDLISFQHFNGEVFTAANPEQAKALCPELGRIALESPEEADALIALSALSLEEIQDRSRSTTDQPRIFTGLDSGTKHEPTDWLEAEQVAVFDTSNPPYSLVEVAMSKPDDGYGAMMASVTHLAPMQETIHTGDSEVAIVAAVSRVAPHVTSEQKQPDMHANTTILKISRPPRATELLRPKTEENPRPLTAQWSQAVAAPKQARVREQPADTENEDVGTSTPRTDVTIDVAKVPDGFREVQAEADDSEPVIPDSAAVLRGFISTRDSELNDLPVEIADEDLFIHSEASDMVIIPEELEITPAEFVSSLGNFEALVEAASAEHSDEAAEALTLDAILAESARRPPLDTLVEVAAYYALTAEPSADNSLFAALEDLHGLVERLTELEENADVALPITGELTEKIAAVFTALGYDKPEETLLELTSVHNLDYVLEVLDYVYQLASDKEKKELMLASPIASASNDNNLKHFLGEKLFLLFCKFNIVLPAAS